MRETKELYTTEDKHTAIDKVAGFTYQFYCFLYHLLTMNRGEVVSFEKWDDAAIDKGNMITMLQAKHTVKVGADGGIPNLTDRAPDLWKAIDVWRDLITGSKGEKRTRDEMQEYIKEHEFVFVCNKQVVSNKVSILCNKLKVNNNDNPIDEVNKVLDEINEEGVSVKAISCANGQKKYRSVQSMINDLRNFELRSEFLRKVTFETKSQDDIKKACVDYIADHVRFSEEDAESVFKDYFTEAVTDLFDKADKGSPLYYTFDEQKKRFERVFQYHREEDLDFQIKMEQYKKEFLDLVCIQQLIKVKDFVASETVAVAKHASYFYSFKNRYYELKNNNRFLDKEEQEFFDNAYAFWENEFNHVYNGSANANEDVIIEKAGSLLYEVRKHQLNLRQKTLSQYISDGAFYYLSDECIIGWHRDWKVFFKKKKKQDGQVNK